MYIIGVHMKIMYNCPMNTAAARRYEPGTLDATLAALKAQGLNVEIEREPAAFGGARPDAVARIGYGGAQALYAIEVKRWLTPATLGAALAQLRAFGPAGMLVTDYATPPLVDKLVELDVAFADAAGNANIRGPNFLVRTTGRRPHRAARPPRAQRAFQPAGLKLVFALLCDPQMVGKGYREIAAHAGVANGTVGGVLRELEEEGYVLKLRRRNLPRQLRNRRRLLDHWVAAYARTLRPQTLIGKYQAEMADWWRTVDPGKYRALWGGETAGALLTEYLKPAIATLYLDGPPGPVIVDHRLRTAADGNVELRRKFWPFEHGGDRPELVPPVLTYADLLATGDARCIETAQRVYDVHLARFFAEG